MKKRSESEDAPPSLRDKIIGLGERSIRKSYFPQLQQQLEKVEKSSIHLEEKSTALLNMLEDLEEGRKKLAASEAQLRAIVETTPDCIMLIAADGTLLEVNEAGRKMLECESVEAVIGQCLYPMIAPEFQEAFRSFNESVIRGNQGKLQFEIVGLKGTRRWLETHAVPLRNPSDGTPIQLAVTRDITESKRAEETLIETNSLLEQSSRFTEALLSAIPTPVFYKDREGRYLGCNRAFSEVMGVTPEEMKGKTVYELWPSEHARTYHDKDLELMKNPVLQVYEFKVRDKCGVDRPVIYAKDVFRDENDQAAGIIGAFLDISERKQAEEALRRLNRELCAISNCNQTLLRAVDEQALLNDVCRIICDEAGYRLAWVGYAENDDAKTVHPAAWAGNEAGYLANAKITWANTGHDPTGTAIRSGESACVQDFTTDPQVAPWREYALQCGYRSSIALPLKDGSARTFGALTIYSTEPNAFTPDEMRLLEELAGDLAFGIVVLRARAERKQAEMALEKSEAKMRGILDNVEIGVSLISPKMEVLELNRRMREWFPSVDSSQHPICYRAFNDPPREVPCDYCPTCKTLRDGLVHEATTQTPRAGATRNYRVLSSPVFNASGEVTAAIEIVEDFTEKLSLESQLRQSQKMDAVGRLAGGVAHDFNNILGVILGYSDLALERVDPAEPIHGALEEIRKAAQRAADLTRQLLAFARKQTVSPKVLELNDTVAGMLSMLRRLIGEDVDLAWLPGEGLWPVKMDPSQVDQILANLCVNARDAIAEVGKVRIETTNSVFDEAYCAAHAGFVPGEYVQLSVSDNGCGIEKEVLQKIFEPFFTTKGIGQGTGLGLSTVYGIVKQNRGFINVCSEPGEGTTFRIYLPRYTGKIERVSAEAQPQEISGGPETILLVEDESATLTMGRAMLERLGYRVLSAGTPGEAIELAEEHAGKIDLLVTDVVMPEMTGRDLCKRLLELYPTLKWLFMSGYTANVIAHHGILEEGVCFIQKPFSLKDLSLKVRETLEKKA